LNELDEAMRGSRRRRTSQVCDLCSAQPASLREVAAGSVRLIWISTNVALANPPYIIDASSRAYREGGGLLGAQVLLEMAQMAVLGLLSVTLEVPDVEPGVQFYGDAVLVCEVADSVAHCRCPDQQRPSIILLGGLKRRRLHHVTLRADDLAGIAEQVAISAGRVIAPIEGFEATGLWVEDPHGGLFHLVEHAADAAVEAGTRRSAILPHAISAGLPATAGACPAVHAGRDGQRGVYDRSVGHGPCRSRAGRHRVLLRAQGQRPSRRRLCQVGGCGVPSCKLPGF
jgi:hypothetical protein